MRKIRIVVSAILLLLITVYFLDFAELLPLELRILEELQLIPALLALNVAVIVGLIVLTLVFGRVYCSSLCPLGIYQDVVSRLRKWTSSRKKKKRHKYLPPLNYWLRYGFLVLTVLGFITGLHVLVGLLDPYSAFGRITVHVFKPVYQAGNNLMFWVFSSFDNHTFYKVGIYLLSISSLIVALVTLVTVTLLAWRNGRIYCNTVCPVGTSLGVLSRYSLFQIRFDSSACTLCGSCTRNCKSSCIDFKTMSVDASRCVACFNCIDSCSESGLKYRLPRKGEKVVQHLGGEDMLLRKKGDKLAEGEEKHSQKKNKHADGEDEHSHKKHKHAEGEEKHTKKKDKHADGEDKHVDGEDKHSHKKRKHAEGEEKHSQKKENGEKPAESEPKSEKSSGYKEYRIEVDEQPNNMNLQFAGSVARLSPTGRRRFLTALGITGLAAAKLIAEKTLKYVPELGIELGPKRDVSRTTPIMPPGAGNFARFTEKCTSCHLCVAKCPAQVIKPAFFDYGLGGMLQPMMNFDNHFCNYDCTLCSDVCPTDALLPLTKELKHHNQMGVVQLYLENCIVYTDETNCGACSEHCPTQAVHMVHYKDSLTIPKIEQEICVGCGGCEYVCPSKPWKAIFVEGIAAHNTIKLEFEEVEEVEVDSFGF